MEERFMSSMLQCYFIAFGVMIGGSFIGSIGAFLAGEPPFTHMNRIAKSLRIWAIVAAIGGTFDVIYNFERGMSADGSPMDMVKQILLIITAMGGAHSALLLLNWLIQEELP